MYTDDSPPRRRFAIIAGITLLHVVVIFGLIRALAPHFITTVSETVLSTFSVTVVTPPPSPPTQAQQPEKSGAAAEIGKKAVPKEVATPKPKITIAKQAVPPIASTGSANSAGASNAGNGTGAGGPGNGTGSGNSGNGQGGGAVTKAVKINGEINSTRDLPPAGRETRQGSYVNVALTVEPDGSVSACRIFRASTDNEADRAVCTLAVTRFHFRPATNANGEPVRSIFGWQQRYCSGNGDCSKTIR